MNVNPIKINIELNVEIKGKWYGKKGVNKQGETEVTFFQREGKRSLLQKFKDFKNNVRSGTELAKKYCNELGISDKVITNPKNKSVNSSITNEELNTLFRATHEKLKNDNPFQKSDPLASIRDKEIKVSINDKQILNVEDFNLQTKMRLKGHMNHTNKDYTYYANHIQLALDILANTSLPNGGEHIDENIDTALEKLNELKDTISLTGSNNPHIGNYDRKKTDFNKMVEHLITTLENAKKTSPNTTANQFNE
jgi:hypothetical protein